MEAIIQIVYRYLGTVIKFLSRAIVIIAVFIYSALAQSNAEYITAPEQSRRGVQASVSLASVTDLSVAVIPFLQFHQKHLFYLGPKLYLMDKQYVIASDVDTLYIVSPNPDTLYHSFVRDAEGFFKRLGIIGGYQFYPNFSAKRIDFYFEAHIQFAAFARLMRTYNKKQVTGGTSSNIIDYYNKIGTDYIFEGTAGYGFNLKITPKIYLTQGAGLGMSLIFINLKNEPNNSISDYAYFIKLGVGYDF